MSYRLAAYVIMLLLFGGQYDLGLINEFTLLIITIFASSLYIGGKIDELKEELK